MGAGIDGGDAVPGDGTPANRSWLIGREAELGCFEELLGRLDRQRGAAVVIEAVAGMGKSSLLRELVARAASQGVAVLEGAADALDGDRPFRALFTALRCTADTTDDTRRELWRLACASTAMAPWEREGATARFAVLDRVVDLIESTCAAGPVVLALDDLHWADAASVVAFGALARLAERLPLLVVGTARPIPRRRELDEVLDRLEGQTAAVVLRPGPLDPHESVMLLRERGGTTHVSGVPTSALGGNPYLLVSAARAGGDSALRGGALPGRPADAVRWALRSRLHGLSPATIEHLRVAAALGGRFDVADVATVRGCPELTVLEELADAVRAGVVVAADDPGSLCFEHDLLREATLEELAEPLRTALDRVIWQQLTAAGRPASTVVTHVLRAARAGDRSAVAVLRQAAEELREADPSDAADLLLRAAELAEPLGWALRAELACDAAEALRLANRLAEVVELLERCLDWPLEASTLARLEYSAALALRFLGRVPESAELLRRALLREALPPAMASWAWSMVVGTEVFSLTGSTALDDALAEAQRAAHACGDRAALVQATCAASSVSWARGRVQEALELADDAADLAAALGNAVWPAPALFRALALLAWGDPDAAIEAITPWGRRAERRGDLWALSRMEMVTAVTRFDGGRWDALAAHCETIVRVGDETGGANGQPLAQALSGLVALRRGDLAAAEAQRAEGHRLAASPCLDPIGLPFLAWLDAELADAAGDHLTARTILDATFDITMDAAPVTGLWIAPTCCRWAMRSGDRERAHLVVERVASLRGTPRGQLVVEACEALAASDTAALLGLAQRPVAQRYPYLCFELLDVALAQLDGGALRDGDDVARARSRAAALAATLLLAPPAGTGRTAVGETAHDAGGPCAMSLDPAASAEPGPADADPAGRTVEVGSRPASRRSAPSGTPRPTFGPHSLTPAERTVLELVAEGLTNAAIAERLFLSKRTVESHVSRMYVKLGLTTRVELARVQLLPS